MKLNRRELREVQYDFNCIANRLYRAEFSEYKNTLQKFVTFILSNPIINGYLIDCGEPTIDIEKEVELVGRAHGTAVFSDFGDTPQEENANILGVLRSILGKDYDIYNDVAFGYSDSRKYQDMISGFNERVVMVMIHHIESYLTKIGIDMGMDETVNYNISITNGQVNMANDNAVINATVNNGIDIDKITSLLRDVDVAASELPDGDRNAARDSIAVVQEEITEQKPRKRYINTAINALKGIKGTAEFVAAVAMLYQFVQTL
jgi:hypothetical protein